MAQVAIQGIHKAHLTVRDLERSIAFDDPDGHSLEFIALLDEPARPELGTMPLSQWRALHA
jgi:hypothetical protein